MPARLATSSSLAAAKPFSMNTSMAASMISAGRASLRRLHLSLVSAKTFFSGRSARWGEAMGFDVAGQRGRRRKRIRHCDVGVWSQQIGGVAGQPRGAVLRAPLEDVQLNVVL